jgi:hypothetical protein
MILHQQFFLIIYFNLPDLKIANRVKGRYSKKIMFLGCINGKAKIFKDYFPELCLLKLSEHCNKSKFAP